jgi:3-mercaptopyruvate sulfurtransferase SseA
VGTRSGFAVQVLSGAGYQARNYVGSWHEWSREVEEPT